MTGCSETGASPAKLCFLTIGVPSGVRLSSAYIPSKISKIDVMRLKKSAD